MEREVGNIKIPPYFFIDNIAQNQSFVQKGIGVKYKNSDSSPTQ